MEDRRYKTVRRQRDILLICLVIFLAVFALYYVKQHTRNAIPLPVHKAVVHLPPGYTPPAPITKMHLVGGFSADTAAKIANASADGIQAIFYYGTPPSEDSARGQQLQSLNMHIIDGFISSNMYYYECQHMRALLIPPYGLGSYCGQTTYPTFASEDAFLATIAAHLEQTAKNPLIIGYWVLDDWPPSDPGSARLLLMKIHQLIQQDTPGRSAICGFGAALTINNDTAWVDQLADNFSPQGCDTVGIYIYAEALPDTVPPSSPETYDWSMSKLLPTMFASLQQRGWNIAKEPLIGIAQAFGGPRANTNFYQVTPNAKDIETQSRSFCEHGAAGLTYYGWSDSGFGPLAQTPVNNSAIAAGIRSGVAACTQYWNTH